MVHGGLRRAPGQAVRPGGVLPILDHIQVEATQVIGAKIVQLLVNLVKLVRLVGLRQFLLQLGSAIDSPAIQGQHVVKIQGIRCRVKAIEIGQQEAGRIANTAVRIRRALEYLVTHGEFTAVIGSGHPQA